MGGEKNQREESWSEKTMRDNQYKFLERKSRENFLCKQKILKKLAKYEYHENIIGHSIDLCEGLKKQINSLIKND
jgi:hypothetical protein